MEAPNVQVPLSVNANNVAFRSNEEFLNNPLHNDTGFTRFHRRTWLQPKTDTRNNREVMTTLLATQGENSQDFIEKLLEEDISYRDLASLAHGDLELIGIKNHKQRQELLNFFLQLPNQNPSYETICQMPEAKFYNRQILQLASGHLEIMRSALSAANYKLKITPPEDVVVGDKSFASRFVLEALDELKGVTDEIEKEFDVLDEMVGGTRHIVKAQHKANNNKDGTSLLSISNCITLSAVVFTSLIAVLCFWKFKSGSIHKFNFRTFH